MGNRRKGSDKNTASKEKGFYDPMAVTWMEKYSDTLDKIWAKLPDCVGSIIVTLAVFIFGATIRGMFVRLNATDLNLKSSSSRAVEYTVPEVNISYTLLNICQNLNSIFKLKKLIFGNNI
jgi:hypothetical protein